MTRPNVLFLMSDEHRFDVSGFGGDEVARTPTLDRLAATGVVFDNAYTPSPICVPGRQSIAAGQFPRTTGCRVYGDDLTPGYRTFAREFARHGYAAVACGKLHHMGTDQLQGWTQRIGGDVSMTARYVVDKASEFDTHQVTGQKWSDAKEIQRAGVGRSPYAIQDDYAVRGAMDFIDEYFTSPIYDRASPDRPLLLKVSLQQPHYPYFAEEDLFRHYLNRVTPYLDQTVSPHPFLSQRQVRPGVDASERELRRATAAYYAMIETMDRLLGKVIGALEEVGQDLDDWIVVYTSDHGEMLGQHGIWEKQKFFEASARVPLVIRAPGMPARRVGRNVNVCDLFATLCDLTGLDVPSGLDGQTLVPLLRGDDSAWSDESISQFGRDNVMIKQGSLKYQWYGDAMPEALFDLARDPSENVDYIDDPAYADVLRRMRKRRDELGYLPTGATAGRAGS